MPTHKFRRVRGHITVCVSRGFDVPGRRSGRSRPGRARSSGPPPGPRPGWRPPVASHGTPLAGILARPEIPPVLDLAVELGDGAAVRPREIGEHHAAARERHQELQLDGRRSVRGEADPAAPLARRRRSARRRTTPPAGPPVLPAIPSPARERRRARRGRPDPGAATASATTTACSNGSMRATSDDGARHTRDQRPLELDDLVGRQRRDVHVHALAATPAVRPRPGDVHPFERRPPQVQAVQERRRDVTDHGVRHELFTSSANEQAVPVVGELGQRPAHVGAPPEAAQIAVAQRAAQLVVGDSGGPQPGAQGEGVRGRNPGSSPRQFGGPADELSTTPSVSSSRSRPSSAFSTTSGSAGWIQYWPVAISFAPRPNSWPGSAAG